MELLAYDPEAGVFRWRVKINRNMKMGDIAGGVNPDSYSSINIDGRRYKAHRIAWLIMTGVWPEADIDHKDGRPGNNRFTNLREADHSENMRNQHRPLGAIRYRGVSRHGRKYRAKIAVYGRQIVIGSFDTPEEAAAAYATAAERYHGEFSVLARGA